MGPGYLSQVPQRARHFLNLTYWNTASTNFKGWAYMDTSVQNDADQWQWGNRGEPCQCQSKPLGLHTYTWRSLGKPVLFKIYTSLYIKNIWACHFYIKSALKIQANFTSRYKIKRDENEEEALYRWPLLGQLRSFTDALNLTRAIYWCSECNIVSFLNIFIPKSEFLLSFPSQVSEIYKYYTRFLQ